MLGHASRVTRRYGADMSEKPPERSTPIRDVPPSMREQLDAPSYMGPSTFGMRPLLTEPEQLDAWQPDVAIVGAPWDDNTTNRPGARFGPRAMRASAYDPGTYHLDLQVEIFDHLEVVDYGDAIVSHGMWELSKAAIEKRVREITSRGIIPIILGGDHSITWPAGVAVAEHHGYGNVVMIHFDAHADTANISHGNLASHGTPMRRLIESGAIPGDRFIQVGLRGYWPGEEDQKWMRDNGLTHFMMQEFWERGTKAVMQDVIAAAKKRRPTRSTSPSTSTCWIPASLPPPERPSPAASHRSTCCGSCDSWCSSWMSWRST